MALLARAERPAYALRRAASANQAEGRALRGYDRWTITLRSRISRDVTDLYRDDLDVTQERVRLAGGAGHPHGARRREREGRAVRIGAPRAGPGSEGAG